MAAAPPLLPGDLAPGDRAAATFDWRGFEVRRVTPASDPLSGELFERAYELLWREFGARGELELKQVLLQRLQRRATPAERCALRYELVVVLKEGALVAVRDHTAIADPDPSGAEVFVHLSHALVVPAERRTGLAAWLRALPVRAGDGCRESAALPPGTPITLVCEMEPLAPDEPDSLRRLSAYQRAGFRMIDPASVNYLQPDFRPPEAIDATGGARPLPLRLVVRRVGRESEPEISGAAVRRMIRSLYRMYAEDFRTQDMAPLWQALETSSPPDAARIPLLPPTLERR